jgi:hypothetical protein
MDEAVLAELDRRLAPVIARAVAQERAAAASAPQRRRLRLLPAISIAAPAAAALAIAVVLVTGGGDDRAGPAKLPVAVQAGGGPGSGGAAAPPPGSSMPAGLARPGGPGAPVLKLAAESVAAGDPIAIRFEAPQAGSVFVSLQPLDEGHSTSTRRVGLPEGSGRLRIATDDLTTGRYALVVSLPDGRSLLRATVEVLD